MFSDPEPVSSSRLKTASRPPATNPFQAADPGEAAPVPAPDNASPAADGSSN